MKEAFSKINSTTNNYCNKEVIRTSRLYSQKSKEVKDKDIHIYIINYRKVYIKSFQ